LEKTAADRPEAVDIMAVIEVGALNGLQYDKSYLRQAAAMTLKNLALREGFENGDLNRLVMALFEDQSCFAGNCCIGDHDSFERKH
jgi:hypothetical protein